MMMRHHQGRINAHHMHTPHPCMHAPHHELVRLRGALRRASPFRAVNLPVWSVVNPPAAGDSNNCISELWATCWNSLSMFLHFTLEFHIKMSFQRVLLQWF
eukprot:Tamp_36509.p1 GENE.Tamp_36509~~Tamp_36509.p1  ORF type:complete len:101 (+),score=1.48 Tamp_36509:125-427(+)